MDDVRRILLCVAGLTPQIITETLYALTQRGERVDEIRVITTLSGRDRIVQAMLDPERGQFFAFCRDYGLDPAEVAFDQSRITLLRTPDGRHLPDIRSVADNGDAADQICDIVRELTSTPHAQLHASVAGGRKTMGIYLTAAMQLFGRVQDQLSHVLVSEDFETHREFFYIPPTPRMLEVRDRHGELIKRLSTDEAEIHLADIPFIRLRGVMSAWISGGPASYGDMVRQAQEDLDLVEAKYDAYIDSQAQTVTVAGRTVGLTVRELFIYALFAHYRQTARGEAGFVALDEIGWDDLDGVFRRLTAARGREFGLDDHELVAGFSRFLSTLADQVVSVREVDLHDKQQLRNGS